MRDRQSERVIENRHTDADTDTNPDTDTDRMERVRDR